MFFYGWDVLTCCDNNQMYKFWAIEVTCAWNKKSSLVWVKRERGRIGDKEGREHVIGIKPDVSGLHRNSLHFTLFSIFPSCLYLFCCQQFQSNLIKAKAGVACSVRWQKPELICDGLLYFIFPLFTPLKCTEACFNAKWMCDKQCFCVCAEWFNKQVFANMDETFLSPPLLRT